jgi:hypothetical protein
MRLLSPDSRASRRVCSTLDPTAFRLGPHLYDNAFDSGLRDDAGQFGSANLSALFPAAHHDLTVFGINAYSNSITAKVTYEIGQSFRRFYCQCADDRSPHSELDHFFHIFSGAQATAKLNRDFNCPDNLAQQISVK